MSASLKKRTKSRHVGMSALWTYAPQQTGSLFDHLVGGDKQPRWHGQAERTLGDWSSN